MTASADLSALLPGYTTGTWAIDPVHSEVSFVVRHLGIAKVRGRFDTFEGSITTAEDPGASAVTATIDTSSVSTGNAQRDEHVRGEDFLHVAEHPALTFRSTGVRVEDGEGFIDGELTLRGVTKPVTLAVELNGFGTGPTGKPAVGFSATTEIKRSEFGVTGGAAGAVVSDAIKITLEVEAHQE
ncbi:YceI family protein [Streptomyces avicenniae]|uniref:YceI family protein n=1 Tax=Streptomyces avicenniae TaxID=500153 RepID=UPI00069A2F44|nr:YceI family protein [Streptomyces avicenniae]